MDSSTHFGRRSTRKACFCGLLALIFLTGCDTFVKKPPPEIKTKSKTELAVEALSDEWLRECEGLPAEIPSNTVGDMASDGTKSMSLLAECRHRHNELVRYMRPIVSTERTGK